MKVTTYKGYEVKYSFTNNVYYVNINAHGVIETVTFEQLQNIINEF